MTLKPPTLAQNLIPSNPGLKDLLDLFRKDLLLSLNCHHIGTVQSFNALTQTATATLNYKKTFFKADALTGQYSPHSLDYPILLDCPVIVLGGAAGALTFPITTGDECLVLFNDRDLDNWFAGSPGGPVATPRLHSFSDGIILVGLRSSPHVLLNYDAVRTVLRNGTAQVGVGLDTVKIANSLYTLNGLLQELITEVKTLVTQTAAITVGSFGSIPANAATITAINTAITATATKIGSLLE